jgi:hypothetical protein
MTVYVLIDSEGVIYGVFSSERKALNYGYRHFGDTPWWDIYERKVDEET